MNLKKSLYHYLKRGFVYVCNGVPTHIVSTNVAYLSPSEFLNERKALITGGTTGIGYEIAKAYINAGAKVCITGRNQEKAEKACDRLSIETNTSECVFPLELNNLDVSCFETKLQKVISLMGGLDILVNNAGVQGGEFPDATEEGYDQALDVNLKAVFFLSQLVGNYMVKNNIKGNILNIASSSSLRPAVTAYTVSKWGLRGLTLGLARALVTHGVTVNGIAPGATATQMLKKNDDGNLYYPYSLLGRYVTPGEIANMAVFLVSDMGHSVVGDIVYMTGGMGLVSFEDMNYDIFVK